MSYRIKVVKFCKRNEVLFSYQAETHPSKGDALEIGGRSYSVGFVRNVLVTVDKGTADERVKLSHVEVEVSA